jgi:tryptophanyl-tRNA synthetase
VDVPFQYLTFFMEDDERLSEIGKRYQQGEMMTGEIKAILTRELQSVVSHHQALRSHVSEALLDAFFSPRPLRFD